MAEKHPYLSGNAGLISCVQQLRNSFPPQVTAETLRKLGIAPNNESMVINILRFVGTLDKDGKKTELAKSVFSQHDDAEFTRLFAETVKNAYAGLFELHSEAAWNLPQDKLISYFRNTDQTSAITGQRQASTFQALASLSGHLELSEQKKSIPTAKTSGHRTIAAKKTKPLQDGALGSTKSETDPEKMKSVGLTVRIEINLPVAPDQETYDRIFRSIRENLLNG